MPALPSACLNLFCCQLLFVTQAVDERQMVAREMSASRLHSNNATSTSSNPNPNPNPNPPHQAPPPPHAAAIGLRKTSSSGSGSGSLLPLDAGLQRASSMNLPKPEESGVPATHPDMCILRIRRNHLVEVGLSHVVVSCAFVETI